MATLIIYSEIDINFKRNMTSMSENLLKKCAMCRQLLLYILKIKYKTPDLCAVHRIIELNYALKVGNPVDFWERNRI